MGQPKNSKKKPKVPVQERVEFNYEDETVDAAYNTAINSPSAAPQSVYEYAMEEQGASVNTPLTYAPQTSLFLINGHVRLTRQGQEPITAEQTRIVEARDFNEAVSKYNNYFASLSNPNEIYTVVGAGGSEAIR